MLAHFSVVFGQVVTLFLMMGVGFALGKTGKIDSDGSAQMSTLLLYVAAPCVVVRALHIERTPGLPMVLATAGLVFFGIFAANSLVAAPLFRRDEGRRRVLQFACVYGNVGFMGIPLMTAVFGAEGALWSGICMVVFTVYQWSHGVPLMGGRFSPRMALVNPGTLALAVGLTALFSPVGLPDTVQRAVSFLADLNTPLAMVVIGMQISRADLRKTFTQRSLYAVALVRLILLPLAVALVLLPLRLDPVLYACAVVLAATPVAGSTAILSNRFGQDSPLAAQAIALTTLLSLVTLPAFAALARALSG